MPKHAPWNFFFHRSPQIASVEGGTTNPRFMFYGLPGRRARKQSAPTHETERRCRQFHTRSTPQRTSPTKGSPRLRSLSLSRGRKTEASRDRRRTPMSKLVFQYMETNKAHDPTCNATPAAVMISKTHRSRELESKRRKNNRVGRGVERKKAGGPPANRSPGNLIVETRRP